MRILVLMVALLMAFPAYSQVGPDKEEQRKNRLELVEKKDKPKKKERT